MRARCKALCVARLLHYRPVTKSSVALTFILAGGVHEANFSGEHDPARTIDIELTYWPSLIEFCNSGAPLARTRRFQWTGLVDAGRASGWEARSNGRRSVAALRGLIVL
jgi:hypothetical protein